MCMCHEGFSHHGGRVRAPARHRCPDERAPPVIATAPSVLWPLLVVGADMGFSGGIAIHRANRTPPPRRRHPLPCLGPRPATATSRSRVGRSCTSCHETGAERAPEKVGVAAGV